MPPEAMASIGARIEFTDDPASPSNRVDFTLDPANGHKSFLD